MSICVLHIQLAKILCIVCIIFPFVKSSVTTWTEGSATGPAMPFVSSSWVMGYLESTNTVWFIGGYSDGAYRKDVMSFDIQAEVFNDSHTELTMSDTDLPCRSKVFATVGNYIYFASYGNVHKYDMTSNSLSYDWRVLPDYVSAPCMATDGEYLFIVGGDDKKLFQIYDIDGGYSSGWSTGPDLLQNRWSSSCEVINGYLYVIAGGTNGDSKSDFIDIVIKIDISDVPNIDDYNWITLSDSLINQRGYFRTAIVGDFIYIVAGISGPWGTLSNIERTVEMLDSTNDNIVTTTSLPDTQGLGSPCVITVNNKLYVFGGWHKDIALVDNWYYSNLIPTPSPSTFPTNIPSLSPTKNPTYIPTHSPTIHPTTKDPSYVPTASPSSNPTQSPTINPSLNPSLSPTINPTAIPSISPTIDPTFNPSVIPTYNPSYTPSVIPTYNPSSSPTSDPTSLPTLSPTLMPISLNNCTFEFDAIFYGVSNLSADNFLNDEHLLNKTTTILTTIMLERITDTAIYEIDEHTNDFSLEFELNVLKLTEKDSYLNGGTLIDYQVCVSRLVFEDMIHTEITSQSDIYEAYIKIQLTDYLTQDPYSLGYSSLDTSQLEIIIEENMDDTTITTLTMNDSPVTASADFSEIEIYLVAILVIFAILICVVLFIVRYIFIRKKKMENSLEHISNKNNMLSTSVGSTDNFNLEYMQKYNTSYNAGGKGGEIQQKKEKMNIVTDVKLETFPYGVKGNPMRVVSTDLEMAMSIDSNPMFAQPKQKQKPFNHNISLDFADDEDDDLYGVGTGYDREPITGGIEDEDGDGDTTTTTTYVGDVNNIMVTANIDGNDDNLSSSADSESDDESDDDNENKIDGDDDDSSTNSDNDVMGGIVTIQ